MRAECPPNDVLSAFLSADLTGPDSAAVSEHLVRCLSCAARVDALARVGAPASDLLCDLGADPSRPPADPEFRAAVEQLLVAPPFVSLPAVGDMLGEYALRHVLGEGGMGIVYRAVHRRLDKEVAVKVIRGALARDRQIVERFEREMKAAGRVRHPNLVEATDAGFAEGVPYLVMEYVKGTDLARLVRQNGPLPVDWACALVREAAAGLQHAHEHGLIHRDVKPSNLMLGDDGVVRVLDLGLALLPEEAQPDTGSVPVADTAVGASGLTSPDVRLGTRNYAAPEQMRDSHNVDPRADVFGLGCTLVYLLTGCSYQLGEKLPPQLPAEVWAKFLAVDPAERFPTAAAASAALAPFCNRRGRTRKAAFLAVAGIVCAIGVWVAVEMARDRSSVAAHIGAPVPAPGPALVAVAPAPRVALPRGKLPMTTDEARRVQTDTADRLGQPVTVRNTLGMDLVLIPRGDFGMFANYTVTLTRPYRIGATEVTYAQFKQFLDANPDYATAAEARRAYGMYMHLLPPQVPPKSKAPYHLRNPGWGHYDDDQPVAYVTWDDAEAFVKWLSAKEKRTYRLPTQAEWVWACRAGTATDFYWGNMDSYSKYALTGLRRPPAECPQPVGQLLPNAWGLYDTFGNVAEMVSDYYTVNPLVGHVTDPTGPPPGGPSRVVCGGSYISQVEFGPNRKPPWADYGQNNLAYSSHGFRVVMEP